MPKLFEHTQIKDLKLSNRFIRSATWEGLADENGACTPDLVERMVELAEGLVGLIITGHTYVLPAGQATHRQLSVASDDRIDGLIQMSEAVHQKEGRIIMQLAHGGLSDELKLSTIATRGTLHEEGLIKSQVNSMTVADIQQVVESFVQAARRAKTAGFDGVQIHAAHGYLLSQFLSPAFNQRGDQYGGTVENRNRIILEILHGIRRTVDSDYPILIKINSEDFIENGMTLNDFVQAAALLAEAGIDAIEVSGGTFLSGRMVPFRRNITFDREQAYFRKASRELKKVSNVPVILIGGIRSYLLAERLVVEGVTDYIAMSRPFIREPMLVKRWHYGDLRRATCISCNGCFGPALAGQGVFCVQDKSWKS